MNKIIKDIFKQYDIGSWWGAAKATFSNAAVYMSIFNTAMIIPMAYVTWIAPWLQPQGIAVPFWVFGSIILVGAVIVMVLEYKLSTPSIYAFSNEQFWKHSNPMRDKIENIEKRTIGMLNKQDKRLERIEKMLLRLGAGK
jgi:hypothetical protein